MVECKLPSRLLDEIFRMTHCLLVTKDLADIEEASRNVGNGTATKGNAGRSIKPVAFDLQFDFHAIGLILEVNRGARGKN